MSANNTGAIFGDCKEMIPSKLTDPYFIVASVLYMLALIGISFTPSPLWPALLFGLGVALLSGIALVITRGQMPTSLDITQPRMIENSDT